METVKVFEQVINNKKLSNDDISVIKSIILKAISKKKQSPSYSEIDLTKIDWDFPFLKKLIKDAK